MYIHRNDDFAATGSIVTGIRGRAIGELTLRGADAAELNCRLPPYANGDAYFPTIAPPLPCTRYKSRGGNEPEPSPNTHNTFLPSHTPPSITTAIMVIKLRPDIL